jgi:hypothetical protein
MGDASKYPKKMKKAPKKGKPDSGFKEGFDSACSQAT